MQTITSRFRESVKEQARVIALENCFTTWDGNVDLDVIIQGLHDRFKAIGRPLEGIRFRRTSLHVVEADFLENGKVSTYKWTYHLGILDWESPDFAGILTPEEQVTMQLWLKDNYYEH